MKKYLNRLFIDGLSGMSYGLFFMFIIGTIICQIGKLVGGNVVATYLNAMGSVAKRSRARVSAWALPAN